MKNTYNVALIVGSLRKGSHSRQLAHSLTELAPDHLKLELVEIGQLPHYNQDYDELPPPAFTEFRERIRSSDAVLFVTPEYNRSVPGVLKNALDVSAPGPTARARGTPSPAPSSALRSGRTAASVRTITCGSRSSD